MVIQNAYRYDVTVTTTLPDSRYKGIVIPGRQEKVIDIKIDNLDPVEIRAKNPSGQEILVNDAYFLKISGTVAEETPKVIHIGVAGS